LQVADDDLGTSDQGGEDRPVTLSRKQLDALERRAKAGDAAVEKAQAAERRAAFLEAGVDMSNPGSAYFVKGYDGEVDVDAIRKAAEEAGFLAKAPQQEAKPPDNGAQPAAGEAAESYLSEQDVDDIARLTRLTAVQSSPDTSGVNHAAEMEKVAQAAAKAGDDVPQAIAAYMMRVGLPVADDDQ
jgi:hypothetical protein